MILKEKNLKKILKIPICFIAMLIAVKCFAHKISKSLAKFLLFIGSFFDFINSFISFIIHEYLFKIKKEKHRYLFYRIIDMVTFSISLLILITVFFIYKQATISFLHKKNLNYNLSTIYKMFLSTIISLKLYYYLNNIYNKLYFKTKKSKKRIFSQLHKNLTFKKTYKIVENLKILIENKIYNSGVIIHACQK